LLPAALILAGIFALCDWFAVATSRRWLEYVGKPGVMAALIAAALVLDPVSDSQRVWFVVALGLCLAGDVLLMLPQDLFLPGLVAFLAGHLAYLGGFLARGVTPGALAIGLAVVALADYQLGRPIVGFVRRRRPELLVAVVAYIAVISAMVVGAVGTGVWLAIVGAGLFFASDGVLAWDRFGQAMPRGQLVVHVLYHLGQAALVGSLVVR